MRTTILIFQPHRREPQLVEFTGAPPIREVEVVVGGPFEQIPEFFSIEHGGALPRNVILICPAYCRFSGRDRCHQPRTSAFLSCAHRPGWRGTACRASVPP